MEALDHEHNPYKIANCLSSAVFWASAGPDVAWEGSLGVSEVVWLGQVSLWNREHILFW